MLRGSSSNFAELRAGNKKMKDTTPLNWILFFERVCFKKAYIFFLPVYNMQELATLVAFLILFCQTVSSSVPR